MTHIRFLCWWDSSSRLQDLIFWCIHSTTCLVTWHPLKIKVRLHINNKYFYKILMFFPHEKSLWIPYSLNKLVPNTISFATAAYLMTSHGNLITKLAGRIGVLRSTQRMIVSYISNCFGKAKYLFQLKKVGPKIRCGSTLKNWKQTKIQNSSPLLKRHPYFI